VVFAHNVFTLHKNLALTAALADLVREGKGRFIAWCHDLAWTNPLYLPALHEGWPWSLLRTPSPGITYVAISHERQLQLATLFGWSPDRVTFVPNGIDAMHFLEASHEMRLLINQLDWWERDLVLLAPARMTRRKNLELAIRVVAELKAAGQRPLLVITGPPGPHNPRKDYAEFLREECQRLQLEEEVCFLSQETWFPGRVSHRLVAELYRWADALLFPSLQEGFGLPMLEAGLARLPIFCMDLPVLQVTGEDDVSYFSPETTPAALAEQIRNTLAAPGPAALRRRVLDEYNWETIYRKGLLPLLNKKVTSDDKPTKRAAIA
jgi:glycosyltransferase involved in cell wall biosynthesis